MGAPNTAERLLLIVTDSVAYMLSAGKTLKELYPKVIHAPCLAYGLHRIAETVREEHPLVNKLISVGKKSSSRPQSEYKYSRGYCQLCHSLQSQSLRGGVPGSRLRRIEELEEDAASIATAKELMQDPKLMPQLIFIELNFKHIPKTIEQLQSHTIPLTSAVSKMEQISQCDFPGPIGEKVKNKVRAVLERNCGWNELKNIAAILNGQEADRNEGWTPQIILQMKFAPSTSLKWRESSPI